MPIASDAYVSWGASTPRGEGDAPVPTSSPPRRGRRWSIAVLSMLVSFALAAGALAATSSTAATTTLRGTSFTTSYPTGWKVATRRKDGAAQYLLSSTGAAISALGIGPAGTVGVTVEEIPAPSKIRNESAEQLLLQLAGTPVKQVTELRRPAISSLDGVQAATFACSYTYRGVANVQVDLVARHRTTVIFLETDADPAKATQASASLATIVSDWRWR